MPKLSEEQHKAVTAAFKKFDKNEDGSISSDELTCVMRCCGQNPTQADVAKMISEMDPNENGRIEYREFLEGMSKRGVKSKDEEEQDLLEAFKIFDRDGNGFITEQELRHTMTCMGERMTDDEVDSMIEEADVNGDGRIHYEEFVRLMTSKS